jgi:hypothetical protein
MPVLIDGNNLMHTLPPGERDRRSLRQRALELVRNEAIDVTVIFDGPPPEASPDIEHLGRLTIRYSGNQSADDAIVQLITSRGDPERWRVVSDDAELRSRVRRCGGGVISLRDWRARRSRTPRARPHEPRLSSHEIADWEDFFASGPREDD